MSLVLPVAGQPPADAKTPGPPRTNAPFNVTLCENNREASGSQVVLFFSPLCDVIGFGAASLHVAALGGLKPICPNRDLQSK